MLMNLRAFYLTAHHFSRSGRAQSPYDGDGRSTSPALPRRLQPIHHGHEIAAAFLGDGTAAAAPVGAP
jgi:hypothetical protein